MVVVRTTKAIALSNEIVLALCGAFAAIMISQVLREMAMPSRLFIPNGLVFKDRA